MSRYVYDAEDDANGVHWFWWLFWLVFAAPVLVIVAIVHIHKLNRAIRHYQRNNPHRYDGL